MNGQAVSNGLDLPWSWMWEIMDRNSFTSWRMIGTENLRSRLSIAYSCTEWLVSTYHTPCRQLRLGCSGQLNNYGAKGSNPLQRLVVRATLMSLACLILV